MKSDPRLPETNTHILTIIEPHGGEARFCLDALLASMVQDGILDDEEAGYLAEVYSRYQGRRGVLNLQWPLLRQARRSDAGRAQRRAA